MSINKYLSHIPSFNNKKILVTGATAGIGLSLTKQLLNKDAHIVMLIRNIEKGERVKEELLEQYPNALIDIVKYDQSDYESIDQAFLEIKEKHHDFYAFVANAGILYPPKGKKSKQNNPLTIETNYLGLRRMMDYLLSSFNNKRYILEGSVVAGTKIKKNTDIYSDKYSLFKQYNISKACVEALFYHYYTTNQDNEFLLTEPGITSSDIFRGFKQPIKSLGKAFVKIFSHSVNKASLTLLKALLEDSQNGDYIVPRGIFTFMGYPKKKSFPNKRKRDFLINL